MADGVRVSPQWRDKVDVLLIAYQELDRVACALSAEADRAIVAGGRALTVLKTAT
jgi:hypothetical protein